MRFEKLDCDALRCVTYHSSFRPPEQKAFPYTRSNMCLDGRSTQRQIQNSAVARYPVIESLERSYLDQS